jgi:hypothetical protein
MGLSSLHRHLGRVATDESTMSALVLAEVVATAEFLLELGALERLVVCVKRAVVTLEVLLATDDESNVVSMEQELDPSGQRSCTGQPSRTSGLCCDGRKHHECVGPG